MNRLLKRAKRALGTFRRSEQSDNSVASDYVMETAATKVNIVLKRMTRNSLTV
jgi:hypothetical protein